MAKGSDVFTRRATTSPSQGLSDPNLGAASFSQQGVVDQSGLFKGQAKAAGLEGIAGGINDFGKIALDLDKRFALLDLEKQVQSEAITPFLESREPGFAQSQQRAFEEASVDNFELEQRANALREIQGEGATIEQLDPEFADVTKRLKNARRQGAMSEDELQLRIKAATRAAINKRPGLMNELTAHAQATLGLSGAQEQARLMDQIGQAEARQDAENRTRAMNTLDKLYVPFDPNDTTENLINRANQSKTKRNAFEAIKNDNELKKEISSRSTQELLESGLAQDIIIGGFDSHATNMADLFTADMTPADFSKAKLAAQAELLKFQASIDTDPAFRRIAGDPSMKKLRDDWVKNMENLNASLQAASNGADVLEVISNDLNTIRSLDERAVLENTSVATVNILQKLGSAFPLLAKDIKIRQPMEDLLKATADGGVKSSALANGYKRNLDSRRTDFASVFGTDGMMKTVVPSTEDTPEQSQRKDPQQYQEHFDTVFNFLENETDINKKNQAIGDLVREMGKPEMRKFYDSIPLQTQGQYLELLEQQTQLVANSMDDAFKKAEEQGIDLRTRVIEGQLRFTSEDNSPAAKQFVRRENARVSQAHKEVIQAFSVRFNKPFAETSTMLQKVFVTQDRQRLMDVLDELEEDVQAGQANEEGQVESVATSFIKDEEGFRTEAYLDPVGVPTIGFGFTEINGRPVKMGDTITREQADRELQTQIEKHSNFRNEVEVDLTKEQEQALSSFEFNLGPNIWNTTGKQIIEAINAGDFEKAAEAMKRHDKAKDRNTGAVKQLAGLTARREKEAKLLLGR